ncbi:MAG: hypothetical protein JW814_06390 [Candidatus Krumholzibacteriota bacterium]|nr:hypothetical protein [Candidatus Krumholzibacteriota bacterium]
MRIHRLQVRSILTFAIILLSSVAMIGCSQDSTSTAPESSDIELSKIAEDPFEQVLTSTDGYTPEDPGMRIDRLAEKLGLDDAQKEALLSAYIEFRTAVIELRDLVRAGEITFEEARAEAVILREAFEAELQLILTPEQYDLLQEMRRVRDRIRDRIHATDKYVRWEIWLTEIGADSAQTADVYLALEALHEGIRDLVAQVKDGLITKEEALLAAQVLRDEFDAALQAILTPEQYDALLALRPDKCKV